MTIEDFEKKATSVINEEVSLSPLELQLYKSFTKIDIRGKRGRKVPLLLTKGMEKGINLLIKLRGGVGVKEENRYVFAVLGNGSLKNIRGPDAIRKNVELCQLKLPEAIYSTNLRKHVATLSQLLNLQQNELKMLARFMGHDIAIHREYYRLPEDTLQLAKCSKILLLMEQDQVGNYSGKSLSEIEINLEDAVEEDLEEDKEFAPEKKSSLVKKAACSESSSDEEEYVASAENPKKRSVRVKPWSEEEKSAMRQHLDKFFNTGKVPRKADIDPAMEESALSNRAWKDVKNFIHNFHNSHKNKIRRCKK